AFPGSGPEADGEVDGIAREVGVACGRFEGDVDARVRALERGKARHEPVAGEAREHAHTKRPAGAVAAEHAARAIEPAERLADLGEVRGALLRQREAARPALEERPAELRFERADLAAHRRRGDAELARGVRE